jgi:hypothetical protein
MMLKLVLSGLGLLCVYGWMREMEARKQEQVIRALLEQKVALKKLRDKVRRMNVEQYEQEMEYERKRNAGLVDQNVKLTDEKEKLENAFKKMEGEKNIEKFRREIMEAQIVSFEDRMKRLQEELEAAEKLRTSEITKIVSQHEQEYERMIHEFEARVLELESKIEEMNYSKLSQALTG